MLNGLPEESGEAAITVTQMYLAGELSLMLARLQQAAADPASGSAFEELRREAETARVAAELGGRTGTASGRHRLLGIGIPRRQRGVSQPGRGGRGTLRAAAAAELYEFGLCAGLLDEE